MSGLSSGTEEAGLQHPRGFQPVFASCSSFLLRRPGTLVALAESKDCDLPDLTLEDMKSAHEHITNEVFDVLGVQNSVDSRMSYGGTAPAQVRIQVQRWKDILK